jgi:hypothetical protein
MTLHVPKELEFEDEKADQRSPNHKLDINGKWSLAARY